MLGERKIQKHTHTINSLIKNPTPPYPKAKEVSQKELYEAMGDITNQFHKLDIDSKQFNQKQGIGKRVLFQEDNSIPTHVSTPSLPSLVVF